MLLNMCTTVLECCRIASEWSTHDHSISQNGRKTQQKDPVAHLTDGKKRQTHTISCHRTVRRKVHRLLGQKIDLRYPRAVYRAITCGALGSSRIPTILPMSPCQGQPR